MKPLVAMENAGDKMSFTSEVIVGQDAQRGGKVCKCFSAFMCKSNREHENADIHRYIALNDTDNRYDTDMDEYGRSKWTINLYDPRYLHLNCNIMRSAVFRP